MRLSYRFVISELEVFMDMVLDSLFPMYFELYKVELIFKYIKMSLNYMLLLNC